MIEQVSPLATKPWLSDHIKNFYWIKCTHIRTVRQISLRKSPAAVRGSTGYQIFFEVIVVQHSLYCPLWNGKGDALTLQKNCVRSKSHSVRSAFLWFLKIQRLVLSLRSLQGPVTGYSPLVWLLLCGLSGWLSAASARPRP